MAGGSSSAQNLKAGVVIFKEFYSSHDLVMDRIVAVFVDLRHFRNNSHRSLIEFGHTRMT